jgi:DNA-directed RNA polymerase specialized sigma24 family protein
MVAGRLGISEPTARARVSRGLAALAELLDRPAIDEARAT